MTPSSASATTIATTCFGESSGRRVTALSGRSPEPHSGPLAALRRLADDKLAQARDILNKVKPLAIEYYRLTNRPLGVTGEIAEVAAVETLGLKLDDVRSVGYDAKRGVERIQIKGRAIGKGAKQHGRMSRIKLKAEYDAVILVLLDLDTLDPLEMYEASRDEVDAMLLLTEAKSRARGQLSVSEFKRKAKRVWSSTPASPH